MISDAALATDCTCCQVSFDIDGQCTLSITEWGERSSSIRLPFSMTMELRELFNQVVSNGSSPVHVFQSGSTAE